METIETLLKLFALFECGIETKLKLLAMIEHDAETKLKLFVMFEGFGTRCVTLRWGVSRLGKRACARLFSLPRGAHGRVLSLN